MEINKYDQLYVNNKWYFDVIDIKDEIIVIRVKYKENPKIEQYTYRSIALNKHLFTNINSNAFIKTCNIDPIKFKQVIGSLIDRLCKEPDLSFLAEDGSNAGNSSGMGNVSMAGLSGTVGVPGSSGSGDISNSILPSSTIGLEVHPKVNFKTKKKMKKIANKKMPILIKQPFLGLKESVEQSDQEYKSSIYTFLDYPTDNDIDIKLIDTINKVRPNFINISGESIKKYLKDLYDLNKNLIKKSSEWFQNNILVLIESQN